MAVSFLQDIRAQTVRGVEKVSDLLPGIGADPEPSMNIGGEAGFLLLHGRPDVAVKVVRPSARGPEFDKGLDFRVPVLVVRHAGVSEVDCMYFKLEPRTGEKVRRHVDTLLVLNHEVEFQRK